MQEGGGVVIAQSVEHWAHTQRVNGSRPNTGKNMSNPKQHTRPRWAPQKMTTHPGGGAMLPHNPKRDKAAQTPQIPQVQSLQQPSR